MINDNISFIASINFNNKIESSTIDKCIGVNNDGTINIKYTLIALKHVLMSDIRIIDELLTHDTSIETLLASVNNTVTIILKSKQSYDKLKHEKIIVGESSHDDLSSDEENQLHNRLRSVLSFGNISNDNDTSPSDNESDHIDDLFYDKKNTTAIINKIIKELPCDDKSSDEEIPKKYFLDDNSRKIAEYLFDDKYYGETSNSDN